MQNYGQISLTSNVANIFEKRIHIRIVNFVIYSKILSEKQYRFIRSIGIKETLTFLPGTICEYLEQNGPITVPFPALTKAFDTVNQNILFEIRCL